MRLTPNPTNSAVSRGNSRYNRNMTDRLCNQCGTPLKSFARADARFCSGKCRVTHHRNQNRIPAEMKTQKRWVNWAQNKCPLTPGTGRAASSTNPATWDTYQAASATSPRLGYVLGEGIGCIDLDNCVINGQLTTTAQELITHYPENWIEYSPSGSGLHIWGLADERAGFKTTWKGLSIEFYSVGRYITVTGKTFQAGKLAQL